jgi:uncharacterized protein (DUF342 family)
VAPNQPDGRVDIHVSADGMEASVSLHGPDLRLTPDQLLVRLDSQGIVFGIDSSAVIALIQRARTERGKLEAVVARGIPVKPAQAAYAEVMVQEGEKVAISHTGQADFRNIAKYHAVKKGEVLFRNHEARPGEPGTDVYGRNRQPQSVVDQKLRAGENVGAGSAPGEFIAQVDGLFERKSDTIHVRTELRIEGDAGLSTGNLEFAGPVSVLGNVEKGTTIHCASLRVGGLVESGFLTVDGPVHVDGGVNTGKEGTLHVRGELHTGYLDNSTLVCQGNVIVARSILSSRVITYGSVLLSSPGSTLAGGEIMSFGSVEADHIGNRTGIGTKITLGMHYGKARAYEVLHKDVEFLEHQVNGLAHDLKEIRAWIPRQRGNISAEKRIEMKSTYQTYRDKLAALQGKRQDLQMLLAGRFNADSVRLVARDTLHPGVEIHFHHHVERIAAPLTKCILLFKPGAEKPEMQAFTQTHR